MEVVVKNPYFVKLLSPTRMKILQIIAENGAIYQRDLLNNVDVNASTLSYHLKVLSELGVISKKREIIQENGRFKVVNLITLAQNDIIEVY